MGLLDSLFLTILLSLFGLLNADSWAVFGAFVAVGGALDTLKNARRFQRPPNESLHLGVWFICIQLAFTVGAVLAFGLSRFVLTIPFETAHDIALQAYNLGAPWIRLLRKQYGELIAHGYDLRAMQIAVYYPIIFALFYLSLTFQAVQVHRCIRALRSSADPVQRLFRAFRERPILMTLVCSFLSVGCALIFYLITAAGIEWNEQGGKWRWDLHQSDGVLFNYIAIMPCVSGMILLVQLCVRRPSASVTETHSD